MHTHIHQHYSPSPPLLLIEAELLSRGPPLLPPTPQVDSLSQTWLPLGGCPASTQSSRAGYKWKKKKRLSRSKHREIEIVYVRTGIVSSVKRKPAGGKKPKHRLYSPDLKFGATITPTQTRQLQM